MILVSKKLTTEDIMERLGRVCRLGTSVRCRTTFPSGPSKWYVSMHGVHVNVHTMEMSGATPQEAIINTWEVITNSKHPQVLVRYFSKDNEPVPGKGPQVWVQWDPSADDWKDSVPPKNNHWRSMASEIRPYAEHKWLEQQL